MRLENNPDLEFELFLAEKLGKLPHEIREMPAEDFHLLSVYYARKAQRQQLEQLKSKGGGRRG